MPEDLLPFAVCADWGRRVGLGGGRRPGS